MNFPSDIKGCMKDCILSLFWRKKDIATFFEEHDCTSNDLKGISNLDPLSRLDVVDVVFHALDARTDNGLGPYRAMLKSLVEWSEFDPYWFETKKKLDRKAAEKNIQHLRQLQEIRDAKIKEDRKRREDEEAEKQRPRSILPEIRDQYLRLHSGELRAQERGYALEKILAELARIDSLEVTEPFRVHGEQIDGTLKFDGEHYLVEAKWQDQASANEPVYQFAGKIEGKMYGRGLFFSVHGFSTDVIRSLVLGKALRTVFVDGEDLILVLEGHLSFRTLIDRKVKAAQTKGLIYVHPLTGASKQPPE